MDFYSRGFKAPLSSIFAIQQPRQLQPHAGMPNLSSEPLEAMVIALYAYSKGELKDLPWYEKVEHESVRNASVFSA